jgi:hypothetical protein
MSKYYMHATFWPGGAKVRGDIVGLAAGSIVPVNSTCRSQWPCGLRREVSALARTLGS